MTYFWAEEDSIWGDMTATGVKSKANRTVAVDPNVIPLHSQLLIDGQIYIAEDVGSAVKGNVIDIYVENPCQERFFTEVYILNE